MNLKLYRTIFSATILQKTALNVGGSESDSSSSATFRDGNGRLTIPATGVAGAFIETAMRLFPEIETSDESNNVEGFKWEHLSGKRRGKSIGDTLSAFNFENVHLVYEENNKNKATEMRQGVGINAFTGTSADKSLFEYEIVPAGTKWKLFLEVDTSRTGLTGEYVAALVLNEWEKGYGWFGKNNARGCGWFELQDIKVLELPLTPQTLEAWPDSSETFEKSLNKIKESGFSKDIPFSELVKNAKIQLADKLSSDWHYIKLSYSIEPGKSSDGYGCDFLQSGGHAANADYSLEENVLNSMIIPPCLKSENAKTKSKYLNNLEMDKPFPMTYYKDGNYKPFLPGSTVRGAFRSKISELKRGKNKRNNNDNNIFYGVLDPNCKSKLESGKFTLGELEKLLGIAIQRKKSENENNNDDIYSSRILVSDAMLTDDQKFSLVQLEQHTEDEFCAGVYGSGKFDCTLLVKGKLTFDFIIEGCSKESVMNDYNFINETLKLAEKGWVPIGGGVYKGFGWLKWICNHKTIRKIADDNAGILEDNNE